MGALDQLATVSANARRREELRRRSRARHLPEERRLTAILGISAFYHDAAAALVVDGRIVAAAEQERFSRTKHDDSFPQQAIDFCLNQAGLSPAELDYVGFYDKPLLKFERLLETYLAYAPAGYRSFREVIPAWLRSRLHVARTIRRGVGRQFRRRVLFAEHHVSHAASAFYPSPFDEAAILTFDGVGEWTTASFGTGRGNRIELTHELRFPHSLGMLYSAFTAYCGFQVNSGEYKLMGLAPYGEPCYADLIRQKLLDLKDDGSFRLDMRYFRYCQGRTMFSPEFERLFGGKPRGTGEPINEREMNLAASIQAVTEEIVLRAARHVHRQTGLTNLCLAGGVALNSVANGRLLREGPFVDLWIQPAAGDSGGAIGVALYTWHELLGNPRTPLATDGQHGSLLGPEYSDEELLGFLRGTGDDYVEHPTVDALCERVATLLADGRVVGWFQGRLEFGPRALGARSIVADPRIASMQSRINDRIKGRESFRPFGPAVLAEHAAEYFELKPSPASGYMLLVAPVRREHRLPVSATLRGLEKLREPRSTIPAVTHVDGSARVQTVGTDGGRFRRLLECFHRATGCPLLVNTSFNERDQPLVCTPQEAYRSFCETDLDVLVLGRCVLVKPARSGGPHLR